MIFFLNHYFFQPCIDIIASILTIISVKKAKFASKLIIVVTKNIYFFLFLKKRDLHQRRMRSFLIQGSGLIIDKKKKYILVKFVSVTTLNRGVESHLFWNVAPF